MKNVKRMTLTEIMNT